MKIDPEKPHDAVVKFNKYRNLQQECESAADNPLQIHTVAPPMEASRAISKQTGGFL